MNKIVNIHQAKEAGIAFSPAQVDLIKSMLCEGCAKELREVYENGNQGHWQHYVEGVNFKCTATLMRQKMTGVDC